MQKESNFPESIDTMKLSQNLNLSNRSYGEMHDYYIKNNHYDSAALYLQTEDVLFNKSYSSGLFKYIEDMIVATQTYLKTKSKCKFLYYEGEECPPGNFMI